METKGSGWKFFAVFLVGAIVGLLASPALNGVYVKSIIGNKITPDRFDDLCEDDDCDCDCDDCIAD